MHGTIFKISLIMHLLKAYLTELKLPTKGISIQNCCQETLHILGQLL